MTIEMI